MMRQPLRAMSLGGVLIGLAAVAAAQAPTSGPAASRPAATPSGGGPRITLSAPQWDFGRVWETDAPTMTLTIRNTGDADLVLKDVAPSCSCTVAQPSRKVIPPGQTAELPIRFDPHGKQGDVGSELTITSNDPSTPSANFKIKGFVKRGVVMTPIGGIFMRLLPGATEQTITVRLENKLLDSSPPELMHLKLERNAAPFMDVQLREVEQNRIYEIDARPHADLKAGRLRGTLLFSTGLSHDGQFPVPVRLRILNRVELEPPAVMPDPKVARDFQVYIHYYGDQKDFKVLRAESSDPGLKVDVGPTTPPMNGMETLKPPMKAMGQVVVHMPIASALPPQGVKVRIFTNDPAAPEHEVLVTNDRNAWEDRNFGPAESVAR